MTLLASIPRSLTTLVACLLIALIDFNNGVFLSNASPVKEQKAVGMNNVLPLTNANDVGSQAVYPLASKVERRPPEGKLEASGSPLINYLPENSFIAKPLSLKAIKPSCFSAVTPVIG